MQLAKNDQFCISLLQVVLLQCENQNVQAALSASPLCQPIRLAAAIAFKNHVHRFWASSEEDMAKPIKPTLLIPEEKKNVVRNNIVEAICNTPKILQYEHFYLRILHKQIVSFFFFFFFCSIDLSEEKLC